MKQALRIQPSLCISRGDQLEHAPVEDSATVLETLLGKGVEISHSCGGMGTCGTCRVEVLSPLEQLADRNEIEAEMAETRGFERHERLACQTMACGGLKIRIP